MLDYNMFKFLDLLSDNNKEDINFEISNNGKKKIRLANIDIDEKDIK